MTAEIVNLRRARKQRDRNAAADLAAANRLAHGRSGAETRLTDARRVQAEARLDGHRLDAAGPSDEGDGTAGPA